MWDIPSGKHTKNYGKIHPCSMGKSTINRIFQLGSCFFFFSENMIESHDRFYDHGLEHRLIGLRILRRF